MIKRSVPGPGSVEGPLGRCSGRDRAPCADGALVDGLDTMVVQSLVSTVSKNLWMDEQVSTKRIMLVKPRRMQGKPIWCSAGRLSDNTCSCRCQVRCSYC